MIFEERYNVWDYRMAHYCLMKEQKIDDSYNLDSTGCKYWGIYSVMAMFGLIKKEDYITSFYKLKAYKTEGVYCLLAIVWFLMSLITGLVGALKLGFGPEVLKESVVYKIGLLIMFVHISIAFFENARLRSGVDDYSKVKSIFYTLVLIPALIEVLGMCDFVSFSFLFYMIPIRIVGKIAIVIAIPIIFFIDYNSRRFLVNTTILYVFQTVIMPLVMKMLGNAVGTFFLKVVLTFIVLKFLYELSTKNKRRIHKRNPSRYSSSRGNSGIGAGSNTSYKKTSSSTSSSYNDYSINSANGGDRSKNEIKREIDKYYDKIEQLRGKNEMLHKSIRDRNDLLARGGLGVDENGCKRGNANDQEKIDRNNYNIKDYEKKIAKLEDQLRNL